MCNEIISKVNSEYDILLEEIDVESIIHGKTEFYDTYVVEAVEGIVQDYVTDLLNSIRERGVDTKSAYTVFIGGGSILLRRFLEKSERLGRYLFLEDLRANAKGYDLLYRMYENRR